MAKKKLEILVVEDRAENVAAARQYFSTRPELSFDVAGNYADALKMANKKVYAGAILDLNFPKQEGRQPENLGLELGKALDKQGLAWVVLTAIDHCGVACSRILFDQEGCVLVGKAPAKTDPKAWALAYDNLLRLFPYPENMEEIVTARKSYFRIVGKMPRVPY
jgi:CheY-like chemotaxis protein